LKIWRNWFKIDSKKFFLTITWTGSTEGVSFNRFNRPIRARDTRGSIGCTAKKHIAHTTCLLTTYKSRGWSSRNVTGRSNTWRTSGTPNCRSLPCTDCRGHVSSGNTVCASDISRGVLPLAARAKYAGRVECPVWSTGARSAHAHRLGTRCAKAGAGSYGGLNVAPCRESASGTGVRGLFIMKRYITIEYII